MTPLPSVETSSAALHQEEAQRELLQLNTLDNESVAMYSRSNVNKYEKPILCFVYGGRGHKNDKCWDVVGYPKWHSKHGQNSNASGSRTKPQFQTNRWSSGSKQGGQNLLLKFKFPKPQTKILFLLSHHINFPNLPNCCLN